MSCLSTVSAWIEDLRDAQLTIVPLQDIDVLSGLRKFPESSVQLTDGFLEQRLQSLERPICKAVRQNTTMTAVAMDAVTLEENEKRRAIGVFDHLCLNLWMWEEAHEEVIFVESSWLDRFDLSSAR